MNLEHITYTGPSFNAESSVIEKLPDNLLSLLKQINGFIQFGGGLHVRGVCESPSWHSIESVMHGPLSLNDAYPLISKSDIPFAEDCVGDQFLLRNGKVIKLSAETGEVHELCIGLSSFLKEAAQNPTEFLGMQPLLQLHSEGSRLEPGELIHVYPPFCTKEAEKGVSLRSVPANQVLQFLYEFSSRITDLPEGNHIEVKVVE